MLLPGSRWPPLRDQRGHGRLSGCGHRIRHGDSTRQTQLRPCERDNTPDPGCRAGDGRLWATQFRTAWADDQRSRSTHGSGPRRTDDTEAAPSEFPAAELTTGREPQRQSTRRRRPCDPDAEPGRSTKRDHRGDRSRTRHRGRTPCGDTGVFDGVPRTLDRDEIIQLRDLLAICLEPSKADPIT